MTIPNKVGDIGEYDAYIHAMIVAAPGFGKTVFAGTAENALFLTTDPEGTISAKAFGSTAKEWRIETWDELDEALRYLRDGGIKEMRLKWVIIDNISEAQNLAMLDSMTKARARNKARDEFVPGMDDHQRSQLMIKAKVKQFHDLPVNILWTSWRKSEEDGEGETFFTCGIHGQQGLLAQTIQGYMNVVGFGEVEENDEGKEVRRIYFAQSKPYMGKDRYVALGKVRTDLTMPKMESLINGAKRKYDAIAASKPSTAASTRTGAKRTSTTPRTGGRRVATTKKKVA